MPSSEINRAGRWVLTVATADARALFLRRITRPVLRAVAEELWAELSTAPGGKVVNVRDLARRLGIPEATARRKLGFLVTWGRVLVNTAHQTGRGRPGRPRKLKLHPCYFVAQGCDLNRASEKPRNTTTTTKPTPGTSQNSEDPGRGVPRPGSSRFDQIENPETQTPTSKPPVRGIGEVVRHQRRLGLVASPQAVRWSLSEIRAALDRWTPETVVTPPTPEDCAALDALRPALRAGFAVALWRRVRAGVPVLAWNGAIRALLAELDRLDAAGACRCCAAGTLARLAELVAAGQTRAVFALAGHMVETVFADADRLAAQQRAALKAEEERLRARITWTPAAAAEIEQLLAAVFRKRRPYRAYLKHRDVESAAGGVPLAAGPLSPVSQPRGGIPNAKN